MTQFRQKDGLKVREIFANSKLLKSKYFLTLQRHIKTRHADHENPENLIQMSESMETDDKQEEESEDCQEIMGD